MSVEQMLSQGFGTRAEVIARLKAHEAEIRALGATALYLFGSAARDEMTGESDVDVFIDYDPEGSFDVFRLMDLRELARSLLHRDVDLTTRDGLHRRLKERIVSASLRVF